MTQGDAQANTPKQYGVKIAGVGSAIPDTVLSNADLERMVDTTDEWIRQRTGIRERRVVDQEHEGTFTLSRDALSRALEHAGMIGKDLDLIVLASVTGEMTCPSVACRVADAIDASPAGAFDVVAACCGFVYSMNLAEAMVRLGRYKSIGVIGCDAMSTAMDYDDRAVSILFGDAAGAAVLVRDEDPALGCLHQTMHADGSIWESLYIPRRPQEIPEHDAHNGIKLGCLRMNGREVYKFAVGKLKSSIAEALDATGLTIDDISQVICHQSNVRMLEAAREKLNIPAEKMYINIDRYGNSSAGSVGLCLDELWQAGRVKYGEYVLFVAVGGGLTWSTSLWKL